MRKCAAWIRSWPLPARGAAPSWRSGARRAWARRRSWITRRRQRRTCRSSGSNCVRERDGAQLRGRAPVAAALPGHPRHPASAAAGRAPAGLWHGRRPGARSFSRRPGRAGKFTNGLLRAARLRSSASSSSARSMHNAVICMRSPALPTRFPGDPNRQGGSALFFQALRGVSASALARHRANDNHTQVHPHRSACPRLLPLPRRGFLATRDSSLHHDEMKLYY